MSAPFYPSLLVGQRHQVYSGSARSRRCYGINHTQILSKRPDGVNLWLWRRLLSLPNAIEKRCGRICCCCSCSPLLSSYWRSGHSSCSAHSHPVSFSQEFGPPCGSLAQSGLSSCDFAFITRIDARESASIFQSGETSPLRSKPLNER